MGPLSYLRTCRSGLGELVWIRWRLPGPGRSGRDASAPELSSLRLHLPGGHPLRVESLLERRCLHRALDRSLQPLQPRELRPASLQHESRQFRLRVTRTLGEPAVFASPDPARHHAAFLAAWNEALQLLEPGSKNISHQAEFPFGEGST